MKTTPNYFPGANASDGSLKVELYLQAQGISYKRFIMKLLSSPNMVTAREQWICPFLTPKLRINSSLAPR